MRPAAAPHNSVVALPDRGERSGGPLNAGGTRGGGGGLVRTRRWTLVGLPPSDPADVHNGVGLSPLHDPTALAEGRVLDEVAVEVDPRLLSARGFARELQGPPGRCVLRVRPAAEPALEDRDEIVGPGHDPDGYGAPVPPIEHGDQLRERQGPAHRSMMPTGQRPDGTSATASTSTWISGQTIAVGTRS